MVNNRKNTMKTLAFSLVLAALTLTANHLNAQDRGLFGMGPSAANYDYNYSNRDGLLNANIYSNTGDGIQNDSFGAPLGSGIAILLAAGAGYAVVRRKRSRKNTMLLLACVALLGFTQCKKEQPLEPQGEQVRITLNVEDGNKTTDGSKAEVDPPHVSFKTGDQILVVYDGKYVGTITHNGTYFSGNVDATGDNTKPLYFYFLGNKDAGTLTAGTTTSCTVNISDQTGYPTLPVISFSASDQNFNGAGSYTARLHNKCSLMKFNVTTPSNSPICITGMNNKVIIDFTKAANDGANNGFTYDQEDGGVIILKGGSGTNVEKWAIVLPQDELAAGSAGSIYAQNGTYTTFTGTRPTIHAIAANGYYHEGGDVISMTVNTATDYIDLGDITASTTIATGKTVIGTLANNVKISIADGATVTLNGVSINASGTWTSGDYAGLTCEGDAIIILSGENILRGIDDDYPGIHIKENKTLTIRGTGSLDASGNPTGYCYSAGIGGAYSSKCGNIVIEGGTITATGGNRDGAAIGGAFCGGYGDITISGGTVTATAVGDGAGIGSGYSSSHTSGNIIISGGTVTATSQGRGAGIGSGYSGIGSVGNILISGGTITATGGGNAAGIGSGYYSSCGGITIESTVTSVTTTKGSGAPNSIGAGNSGTCGTVKFGNATVYDGSDWTASMEAGNYGGLTLAISTTTNDDDTWTLTPIPVKSLSAATAEDVGKLAGQNGKIYDNAAAATAAGTTAVAKIIYVGSSTGASSPYTHGLALALADESRTTWADAQTDCDGKNSSAPVTGASWMLPSKAQWETMISAAGNHTTLRDGFNSVGGTNIQKDFYWSSTSSTSSQAQAFSFNFGFWGVSNKTGNCFARACLAF